MVETFSCSWCRGSYDGLDEDELKERKRKKKISEEEIGEIVEKHLEDRLKEYAPVMHDGEEFCSPKCVKAWEESKKREVWVV